MQFVSDRIESLWEKEKMLVIQHFLLFPKGFQKLSFSASSVVKLGFVWLTFFFFLNHTKIFKTLQIESICSQQMK